MRRHSSTGGGGTTVTPPQIFVSCSIEDIGKPCCETPGALIYNLRQLGHRIVNKTDFDKKKDNNHRRKWLDVIDRSALVVFCCTSNFTADEGCLMEMKQAIDRHRSGCGLRIICAIIDESMANLSWPGTVHPMWDLNQVASSVSLISEMISELTVSRRMAVTAPRQGAAARVKANQGIAPVGNFLSGDRSPSSIINLRRHSSLRPDSQQQQALIAATASSSNNVSSWSSRFDLAVLHDGAKGTSKVPEKKQQQQQRGRKLASLSAGVVLSACSSAGAKAISTLMWVVFGGNEAFGKRRTIKPQPGNGTTSIPIKRVENGRGGGAALSSSSTSYRKRWPTSPAEAKSMILTTTSSPCREIVGGGRHQLDPPPIGIATSSARGKQNKSSTSVRRVEPATQDEQQKKPRPPLHLSNISSGRNNKIGSARKVESAELTRVLSDKISNRGSRRSMRKVEPERSPLEESKNAYNHNTATNRTKQQERRGPSGSTSNQGNLGSVDRGGGRRGEGGGEDVRSSSTSSSTASMGWFKSFFVSAPGAIVSSSGAGGGGPRTSGGGGVISALDGGHHNNPNHHHHSLRPPPQESSYNDDRMSTPSRTMTNAGGGLGTSSLHGGGGGGGGGGGATTITVLLAAGKSTARPVLAGPESSFDNLPASPYGGGAAFYSNINNHSSVRLSNGGMVTENNNNNNRDKDARATIRGGAGAGEGSSGPSRMPIVEYR